MSYSDYRLFYIVYFIQFSYQTFEVAISITHLNEKRLNLKNLTSNFSVIIGSFTNTCSLWTYHKCTFELQAYKVAQG